MSDQPHFLRRAPVHIRYNRESYFEPKFVSIGPYYHNKLIKEQQDFMSNAKKECITFFLDKQPTASRDISYLVNGIYTDTVKGRIETWYGKSYIEHFEKAYFHEMLITDSCFIIRIILTLSRKGEENMFFPGMDIRKVRFELLLLENQIPFFFLKEVYNFLRKEQMLPKEQSSTPQQGQTQSLSQQSDSHEQTTNSDQLKLLEELKPFIWLDMPWEFNEGGLSAKPAEPEHLLDLYWKCCLPEKIKPEEHTSLLLNESSVDNDIQARTNQPRQIPNAYELYKRVGITFQKTPLDSHFGVTSEHGILQFPHLLLDQFHATLLVNLIAFEEYKPSKEKVLTSYILLLDGLVISEKDVELLQKHGVITEKLGSRQLALEFLNDIGNACTIAYNDHYCQAQFEYLNSYYKSIWKHHWAYFHRRHLKNPWKVISLIAGILILLFSGLGTAYTIANYYNHRKHK